MLRLSIHRAASGMVLAMPVLLPEKPEHVLLKPGATLDPDAIARLIELNVRSVCIEYPPTAYLMRYCSPAIVMEQASLAARVATGVDAVAQGLHGHFDFLSYLTGVRSLIQVLIEDPAAAVFVGDIIDCGEPLAGHCFNVGVLSLLMGLRLDGYLLASRRRVGVKRAQSVENLGLGGLLHDVGMLRIDGGIAAAWARTGAEDDPLWREHVIRGYEVVKGKIPPTAAATVLHHHQRLDGSGFPQQARGMSTPAGLAGRDIHVFTRIAAVADVFDRFRRPPGDPGVVVPTVRALRQTLDMVRSGKLDPVAFRALLTVCPAFPPGSVVQLNDGRSYVVTAWDPAEPCRPSVSALAFDDVLFPEPRAGSEPPIDLRERRALRVVKAEGHIVTQDLFDPLLPGEFDLHAPYPWALIEPPGITAAGQPTPPSTDAAPPASSPPQRKAS